MINLQDTHLHDRLAGDEQFMDDHLFALDRMIASAAGPHYSQKNAPQAYTPENHYHSYTSLMVSELFMEVPEVDCTTRRPGTQMETAEAMRHGMNRWSRDSDIDEVGLELASDYCYMWGLAMVRQVPNRHMGKTTERWLWDEDGGLRIQNEQALWPAVYRIPQPQCIIDSRALTTGKAEYIGHIWFQDSASILAEAKREGSGWDVAALESVVDAAAHTGGEVGKSDPERDQATLSPPVIDIEFATLWMPGVQVDESKTPDEGYHGALMTVARCQGRDDKFKPVKKEDYYGPESGPYQFFGAYHLPNRLLPLGPLVAVEGQIRELNRQARALSRSSERHKRVILFDERDKRTALKLKNAQHDFFVGLPDFDKQKFAEAEIGGATESQYKAVAYHQDRLNRISAMDEAQQGNVTGVGTATENEIAAGSTEKRKGLLKRNYARCMEKLYEKVGWFLYHDSRVVFPLGEEAAEDLGMVEPWFHGGTHDKGSDGQYADLELKIKVHTMQRPDAATRRAQGQAAIAYALNTGPLRPQMPYLDWERMDDMAAMLYDSPELALLFDNEAAMAAEPFQEGRPPQQPRLEMDVGSERSYALSFRGAPRVGLQGPKGRADAIPGGNNGVQMLGGSQVQGGAA